MKTTIAKKRRFFYGYWVLLVAFICVFISMGVGTYPFSLYITSLETEFGWGRGVIMGGITIFFLSMAIASPFVGKLVDWKGAKVTVVTGAAAAGLGYLLLSFMHDIYFYYICYAIIGSGMAAVGQIPAATAVSNWFRKRRGLAIGIMASGIGAGGIVMAPLISGLLIPALGWRSSYIALAFITWLPLIPLALFLLKTKPSDKGLFADGAELETIQHEYKPLVQNQGITLRTAIATLPFWLMMTSFLIQGFCQAGYFHDKVPNLQEIGFTPIIAATALGVVGIGSMIGKFGFGLVCDYIPARLATIISILFQIISLLLTLCMSTSTPMIVLWVSALLLGLGMGGYLPTMSIMTSSFFGLKSFGAILGILSFMFFLGCGIGPLLAGYLHDVIGSYYLPFRIFLILYIVSIVTILIVRPLKLSR